jgi:hypothetical protein
MYDIQALEETVEGTIGEVLIRLKNLSPQRKARIQILPETDQEDEEGDLFNASIEEQDLALDEIATMNKDIPPLPDHVFSRENIYGTDL